MIARFGIHWLIPLSFGVATFALAKELGPLPETMRDLIAAFITLSVMPIAPIILTGTELMFDIDLARRLYGRKFCRMWGLDVAEDRTRS